MPETRPPNPGLNKPASGTYGEKAEIEELKAGLPSTGVRPGPTEEPREAVPAIVPFAGGDGPGRPEGPALPPGLPPALLETGALPSQPGLAPTVGGPDLEAAVTDRQRRLALIDFMANNDTLSPRTREWFQQIRELYLTGAD